MTESTNYKLDNLTGLITDFLTDFKGVKGKIDKMATSLDDTRNKVKDLEKRIEIAEKLLLIHRYSFRVISVLIFVIFITMET